MIFGVVSLAIIILLAILIAYLGVRRSRTLNHAIDTMSMLPYIMPGSIIGIALVIAFGRQPFALTGTCLLYTSHRRPRPAGGEHFPEATARPAAAR